MISIVLLGVLSGFLTAGYLMVLYYRVSSIVLNGSVLQGVPYDLANSIVLCDLHFLRVDLTNLRCS